MPMGRCCPGRCRSSGTHLLRRSDFGHFVHRLDGALARNGPTPAVAGSLGARFIRGGLGDQARASGAAGGSGNGIGHTIGRVDRHGRCPKGQEQGAGEGEAEGKGETKHRMRISDQTTVLIVTVQQKAIRRTCPSWVKNLRFCLSPGCTSAGVEWSAAARIATAGYLPPQRSPSRASPSCSALATNWARLLVPNLRRRTLPRLRTVS